MQWVVTEYKNILFRVITNSSVRLKPYYPVLQNTAFPSLMQIRLCIASLVPWWMKIKVEFYTKKEVRRCSISGITRLNVLSVNVAVSA